jgi:hypothetical protein
MASNRRISPWGLLAALLVFFLIYGLVLSQLVELTV